MQHVQANDIKIIKFWAELLEVDEQVKDLKLVELAVREILRDIPVSRLRIFPCQGN